MGGTVGHALAGPTYLPCLSLGLSRCDHESDHRPGKLGNVPLAWNQNDSWPSFPALPDQGPEGEIIGFFLEIPPTSLQ